MHGPSSEPEQPALATPVGAPATRQCCHVSAPPSVASPTCLLSSLGSGFHVPVRYQLQQPSCPTNCLVARREKQQQPSPSSTTSSSPPASLSCQSSNLQLRGLRYGFIPRRILSHTAAACFCIFFSSPYTALFL
jgi:hypothetical protein